MIGSLRTRLFLVFALVLAASVAASSLLSRRAALIEVHRVVGAPVTTDMAALDATAREVEQALRERGVAASAELDAIVGKAGDLQKRPLILVDAERRALAGSPPEFAAARVREATPDGTLELDVVVRGQAAGIGLRGAPVRAIRGDEGTLLALLFVLPDAAEGRRAEVGPALLPPWILTTAAIGVIALVMTFALSRRVLRPVGALTRAADRMRHGDMDARVDARGTDEISELSRAFNSMADRIAETEALRRQLVSDVAHELRSPVTNLRCTLESIQDGLVEPDRAAIDVLHDETLFLQRLIGDLEDLARADAGRLELHLEEMDLEAVVRRAAATLSADRGGAPIEIRVMPGMPAIQADPGRIEQVCRNLLINARTHTPADGRITVELKPDADGVVMEVRDTGRGIAAEDVPRVFDRFYRADRSRTRATGGAGLGLAIVRQLVHAHGGSVIAASPGSNQGATFTVTLPALR